MRDEANDPRRVLTRVRPTRLTGGGAVLAGARDRTAVRRGPSDCNPAEAVRVRIEWKYGRLHVGLLLARGLEAIAAPVFQHMAVRVFEVDVRLALLVVARSVEADAVPAQVLHRGVDVAVVDPEIEVLAAAALKRDW